VALAEDGGDTLATAEAEELASGLPVGCTPAAAVLDADGPGVVGSTVACPVGCGFGVGPGVGWGVGSGVGPGVGVGVGSGVGAGLAATTRSPTGSAAATPPLMSMAVKTTA
jgi:hypothetical protein